MEKTVVEKVRAPDSLLQPCAQPNLDTLFTNRDIEVALAEALLSIDACSEDKKQIREWQDRGL